MSPRPLSAGAVEEVTGVTQVLDYRPPLADRPLTRVTTWLATPMSPRWRTVTLVSSGLVLWGAAWLPGAGIVETAGWLGLSLCATYGCVRKPMRWIVRRAYGLPPLWSPASEWYSRRQLLLLILAVSSPLFSWPLRISVLVHRPLLDQFAWHVYAEAPNARAAVGATAGRAFRGEGGRSGSEPCARADIRVPRHSRIQPEC